MKTEVWYYYIQDMNSRWHQKCRESAQKAQEKKPDDEQDLGEDDAS